MWPVCDLEYPPPPDWKRNDGCASRGGGAREAGSRPGPGGRPRGWGQETGVQDRAAGVGSAGMPETLMNSVRE